MSFVYDEKKRNVKMIRFPKEYNGLFYGDKGDGKYEDKKKRPYILQKGENNLYEKIRNRQQLKDSAIEYFNKYNIKWHDSKDGSVPTNTLESQVSCINHLFPIRNNPEAVKSIINGLGIRIKGERVEFDEILPITEKYKNGKDSPYIAFEVIEKMALLGEGGGGRGWGRTSIDALIYAKEKDVDKKWIIVIEWKYKEFYINPENLATEGRRKRYNKLIQKSSSLIPLCEKGKDDVYYSNAPEYKEENCVYYYDPYYELMRQTLWAELVAKHIKERRKGEADHLHICVVPKKNRDFLDKGFKDVGRTMEETWRRMLTGEGTERFKIIDPEDLFEPLKDRKNYPNLVEHINYLKERYWNNDIEEDFESTVNKTEDELVNHRDCKDGTKGWGKIFRDYADVLNKKIKDYGDKGEKIKDNIPDEVQLYGSLSKVKYPKKGTTCYELRFCGQRICGVSVLDSDVENPIIQFTIDDMKRNKKWFRIKDMKDMPLKKAEKFFKNFTPDATNDAKKVKSWEHKLESLVLREMAKEREAFRGIEPVKLGAGFFQMPSAVKASTLVPEISEKKNGTIAFGYIDIPAKVSFPNGGWMPAVIEVKDENNPDKPVEAVITQALIYATFLGHLLADKECGKNWYNIIGGAEGNEEVPDNIDILVVAMMPPKKYGEPDKINEPPIPLKQVGDKNIRLIPCTCYIDADDNFTTINSVEWSCFKKNR